ncbi:unnamed protein product [Vitrella brassicaformis CCMP3155]|uniref:DUS-like FMN-binding domain-containing protein n=2 Tax=Vitrella brassicaformis TaxID=1169539 RepID=A0A0G4FEN4_VITBC|nr:unnamed protein product [Vitrella brassicaformis CCMP3155]|mmetsp:Transcript_9913/g.28589  ORF Transcript_9913/g.28589 Transcript_9913/m.28589 type:complete len:420 (+) Transcript_9913:85-1344(+)|eukprot:CEM11649.1 unnamed protein product [Vitrella brassicaformis CCMP3155]
MENDEVISRETNRDHATYPDVDYRGKLILAPMVHAGNLAMRLECLSYGADLVYGEEIIDRRISSTVRTYNDAYNTVEYRSRKDGTFVFSTNREERGKVVFQLGTADATQALLGAQKVVQDVCAVDVNMGCPKSFSVKGGMGAALLSTPLVATDILKTLRRNLPCPVTCKIRLLDTMQKTIDFALSCEDCGIAAIAVHAREKHERPAHAARWDSFRPLKESLSIPLIANGDFMTRRSADKFRKEVGWADSLMIARGALWNPAIFLPEEADAPTRLEVIQKYIRRAITLGHVFQNIKYTVLQMISQDGNLQWNEAMQATRSPRDICDVFDLAEWYSAISPSLPQAACTLQYYRAREIVEDNAFTFAAPAGGGGGGCVAEGEEQQQKENGVEGHPVKRRRLDVDAGVDGDEVCAGGASENGT